jgi:hypothetical protein
MNERTCAVAFRAASTHPSTVPVRWERADWLSLALVLLLLAGLAGCVNAGSDSRLTFRLVTGTEHASP